MVMVHALPAADDDGSCPLFDGAEQVPGIFGMMLAVGIDGDGPFRRRGCRGETRHQGRPFSQVFLVAEEGDSRDVLDPFVGAVGGTVADDYDLIHALRGLDRLQHGRYSLSFIVCRHNRRDFH